MLAKEKILEILARVAGVSSEWLRHLLDMFECTSGSMSVPMMFFSKVCEWIQATMANVEGLNNEIGRLNDELKSTKAALAMKGQEASEWQRRYFEEKTKVDTIVDMENRVLRESGENQKLVAQLQSEREELDAEWEAVREARAEMDSKLELLAMFGISGVHGTARINRELDRFAKKNLEAWSEYKVELIDACLVGLHGHLKEGWDGEKFKYFWHRVLEYDEVRMVMNRKTCGGWFNVKLMINILGWMKKEGIILLNASQIDKHLPCMVNHGNYFSHFDANDGKNSELSWSIVLKLEKTLGECAA